MSALNDVPQNNIECHRCGKLAVVPVKAIDEEHREWKCGECGAVFYETVPAQTVAAQ